MAARRTGGGVELLCLEPVEVVEVVEGGGSWGEMNRWNEVLKWRVVIGDGDVLLARPWSRS